MALSGECGSVIRCLEIDAMIMGRYR